MKLVGKITFFASFVLLLFAFTFGTFAETNAVKREKYGEAPMLAEKVDAGELPPVEQRLPENPIVDHAKDVTGVYGGTLRLLDQQDRLTIPHRIRNVGLFRYNMSATDFSMDVAESYEWSNEYRTLTIRLRKGMKWSDGQPFTTEDVLFKYQYARIDPDVNPAGAQDGFWAAGGEMVKLDVLDETTFSYTWKIPMPTAMDRFARGHFGGIGEIYLPAHWAKQWHPKGGVRTEEDLNELAKENGLPSWVDLFNLKVQHGYNGRSWDLSRPVEGPWYPIEIGTDYYLMQRNPYYYHVDQDGNQLPYTDYVKVSVASDQQLYAMKLSAGESDFAAWWVQMKDMELYKAQEQQGNYTVYLAKELQPSLTTIYLNQTCQDDVKRELFQNKDFRWAISKGIDRQKMNDVLYFGLAEIAPPAPLKGMPWYDPAWENDALVYDLDTTNQMLDELGLNKKDAEDYRLMKDGRRLSLIMEGSDAQEATAAEMLISFFKNMGIELVYKKGESTVINERVKQNQNELIIWNIGRATMLGRGTPDIFGYERPGHIYWADQYARWFITGGAEGIEPPQAIKDHYALWQEFRKYPSKSSEAIEFGKKYYSFFPENMWFIPAGGQAPHPVIIHNRIQNAPAEDTMCWGSDNNMYAPYHPELFAIVE